MKFVNKYNIGVIELLVIPILGAIILWYFSIEKLSPIDHGSILPFQIFGWGIIMLYLILFFRKVDNTDDYKKALPLLLNTVLISIFFIYLNSKASEFPYVYRYILTNKTSDTIDSITIINKDKGILKNISPNATVKLTTPYIEGENRYINCYIRENKELVYLPGGGSTNSVGYIIHGEIISSDNQLTVNLKDEKNSSH